MGQGAGKGHLEVGVVFLGRGFWINEGDEISGREGVHPGAGDGEGVRAVHLHVHEWQRGGGTYKTQVSTQTRTQNHQHLTCVKACHSSLQFDNRQRAQRMLATCTRT